jgi:DUF971 family protein
MVQPNRDAIRPAGIEVDPEAGLMRITWQDGHVSLYEVGDLRQHCPCAACQGEMGIPGAVNESTQFTTEQRTLIDMQEVGRYALQPTWGDGHQTGFYTFLLLRALCPCETCRAERTTAAATGE